MTILVADGEYDLPERLQFDHRDGARLKLEGNVAAPASVVLNFAGSDGIVVERGSAVEVDGVTLVGDGTAGTAGVRATTNGVVVIGGAVTVTGFDDGMVASHAGAIDAVDGVSVSASGSDGLRATDRGFINAPGSIVDGSGDIGVHASNGASIECQDCDIAGSGSHGVLAEERGVIRAQSAVVTTSGDAAVRANLGAYIYANSITVEANGFDGILAARHSTVPASQATVNNADRGFACGGASFITAFNVTVTNSNDSFDPNLGTVGNHECYINP